MIYGFNIIKNKKIFYSFLIGIVTILSFSIIYIPALNQKTRDIFDTKENTIKLDQNASLGKAWNGIAIRKAISSPILTVFEVYFIFSMQERQLALNRLYLQLPKVC